MKPRPAAEPAVDLGAFQEQFSAFLLHRNEYFGSAAAPQIYRNNVMLSLTRALGNQFPALCKLVGEQFFGALARDFVLAHPPTDPSLTFYGSELSDYIDQHPGCRRLPWLADVARLEYRRQEVRHAADEPALVPQLLAEVAEAQLANCRLVVRQSVRLLRSGFPVDRIYQESLREQPERVEMPEGVTHYLLILRRGLEVEVSRLTPEQHDFLALLQAGQALGEAWEHVYETHDLEESALVALLSKYLTLGVFTQLR